MTTTFPLLLANGGTPLGFEVPGMRWGASNPSLLPGDLLVFQMGDQVLLLDLPHRRVGLLAHGIQPVVVIDEFALPPPTTAPAD